MNDTPTADVTARVMELVGRLIESEQGEGLAQWMPLEVLARGLAYLQNEQEEDGCWWGRWGVNYIHGTCGALMAMLTMQGEEIRRGAKWLVKMQNKKGK
ncbi:hypothetical protein GOP47_0003244 [Adiantum capillus-veneris]|uniref:Squalene cyclase C-terminal domain-containing protein n=1 Tax=Adiantum capillus-veneris TaxID=13818 RepID=A0A9D4ZRN0_ADICA|nr:hypothetical protein GOP47_0003244 [Adiantum capillus-veneris]